MKLSLLRSRKAFTLVEIMIVIAIIAILSALAVNNVIRARKRAQSAKILDDLRTLDGALDQWALEHNKSAGDVAEFADLSPYLKQANKLNLMATDLFGQPYGPYSVDTGPKLAPLTYSALSDVSPAEYWSPFL